MRGDILKRRIIIFDSDKRSERLVKNLLTDFGYEVLLANGFGECYNMVSSSSPDILIFDPLFPKKEGIDLIKRLREWSLCTVIAISANATERAVTEILDAGADDYIKKPFFSGELLARIRTAIRHSERLEAATGAGNPDKYINGDLMVDFNSHNVAVKGKNVHLTKNEFRILSLLCRFSGKVLTYDHIIKAVWGQQAGEGNGILRVNIANLRKKIENETKRQKYIFTENGVGYLVAENEAD